MEIDRILVTSRVKPWIVFHNLSCFSGGGGNAGGWGGEGLAERSPAFALIKFKDDINLCYFSSMSCFVYCVQREACWEQDWVQPECLWDSRFSTHVAGEDDRSVIQCAFHTWRSGTSVHVRAAVLLLRGNRFSTHVAGEDDRSVIQCAFRTWRSGNTLHVLAAVVFLQGNRLSTHVEREDDRCVIESTFPMWRSSTTEVHVGECSCSACRATGEGEDDTSVI